MLFPILISTSKDSRTLMDTGSRNSAWRGLKTCTAAADENLSPAVETVKAHSDHFPASCGAEIVKPVEAISDLKTGKRPTPYYYLTEIFGTS